MSKPHAVVVLPLLRHESSGNNPSGGDRIRRFLGRGRVTHSEAAEEVIVRVATALGLRTPAALGAMRRLGQAGERPTGWIAAADPVHFVPGLTTLSAQVLDDDLVEAAEVDAIFETLQGTLAEHYAVDFSSCDRLGYLSSDERLVTGSLSPALSSGRVDGHAPSGDLMTRIRGETEMLLHDHEVNRRRADRGLPAINGLWYWGGGRLPDAEPQSLPRLYGDDPLFVGYWRQSDAKVASFGGDLGDCVGAGDFVAVSDDAIDAGGAEPVLQQLQQLLDGGDLAMATIIFRGGPRIDVRRGDRWRFWRRSTMDDARWQ
jgi:hypothetical protein